MAFGKFDGPASAKWPNREKTMVDRTSSRATFRAFGTAATLMLAAAPVSAQSPDAVAQFYRDKTVTIIIGSTPGGGTDLYGRLFARHMGKYIPGNPRIVPQNLPGAGSIVATAHLYSAAPRDGTVFGSALAGAILDPLMAAGTRKYEPARFSYVGNANLETQVCVVRRDAEVKKFEDIFAKELIVGGSGPGSALLLYPLFLKNIFGAKVKLVAGYPGSREISLAILKGEVQGTCGLNLSTAMAQFQNLLGNPDVHVLVQEDIAPHAALKQAGVPLAGNYLKNDDDRRVAEVFYVQSQINRVFFAPPEVPADRIEALRKAFMATIADRDMQAEATKASLELDATPGDKVQALVAKIYATPPAIIERMKKATESN